MIASLGRGDMLVIGDAGLPVPPGVELIDLALIQGIPDFVSALNVVLSEMQVESHVLAEGIRLAVDYSPCVKDAPEWSAGYFSNTCSMKRCAT